MKTTNIIMDTMVIMLMMMLVMGRYPCLTYQSTLASYFQSLLTPRSESLITFFAQLSLFSLTLVSILLLYSKRHLLLSCKSNPLGRPDDPRISFSQWCHFSAHGRSRGSHRSNHCVLFKPALLALKLRLFLLLITIILIRHAVPISQF